MDKKIAKIKTIQTNNQQKRGIGIGTRTMEINAVRRSKTLATATGKFKLNLES